MFFNIIIYLFLALLGLHCCLGFPPVVSRGYSPVAVWRLLIVVASWVAKLRLYGSPASVAVTPRLYSTDSIVVVHALSFSEA